MGEWVPMLLGAIAAVIMTVSFIIATRHHRQS